MSLIVSSELGNLELVRLLLKCGASADSTHLSGTTVLMTACTHGHVGVAALLLNYGARIDMTGPDGARALMFACQEGHIAVTKLLLQRGANANVTRDNGSNALMAACFRGHTRVADLLLNEGVTVNSIRRDGVTALMLASNKGHVEVAELLLRHGAALDFAHVGGSTALMSACQHGHPAMVQLLLNHDAPVNSVRPDGRTALMIACEQGYTGIAELLLMRGASVDMTRPDGSTVLFVACLYGNVGVILLLLQHGASANATNRDGFTALMVASQQGHARAAELLMERGASVDAVGPEGVSALMLACQSGYIDVAEQLVTRGANVNLTRPDGVTALMMASEKGHTSAAQLLLEQGARVNTTSPEGLTALITASQNGHLDVAELLLTRGADVNATRVDGTTALITASQKGHAAVVELLLNRGAGVDMFCDSGSALMISCQNGFIDVVDQLLTHGASVDLTRDDSSPALMLACQDGYAAVVKLLLERGASVDLTRSDGVTALMWACQGGHIEVAKVLLKHGASVEATGLQGLTVLMMACEQGNIGVIELLLTHGASVDATKSNGSTALITACLSVQTDAVELLLRSGASANSPNTSGVTPLMAACERGVIAVIDLLIWYGADVDMVNEGGFTALMWASADDHADVAEVLLNHGANIHLTNAEGTTALMQACSAGHTAVAELLLARGAAMRANDSYAALMVAASTGRALIIELLVKYGASVNMASSDGFSVLMAASANGHAAVTELLLNYGASVDLTDKHGRTALMRACLRGHADVTRVLLSHGASVGAFDKDENTPLMVACREGHSEVTSILLSNSASVHAANEQNETALLVAVAAGHFKLSRMLLDAGASVHVCAASDETPFTAAARRNHLETVTMLNDAGYSARRNNSSLPASLFPSTLQTLHKYGVQAHEFESMWSCAVKRLTSVYVHLEHDESLPQSTFRQFGMILARLIKLHAKCETTSVFTRLVMSRSVASRFDELHTEIDFLLRGPAFCNFEDEGGSQWRVTWESKVARLLATFESSLADDQVVLQSLRSELDQVEVLSLLQHELHVRSSLCSPELRKLLQSAYQTALQCWSIQVAEPPRWLLPDHEIDLDAAEVTAISENSVVLLRGKWLNSVVTVRQLRVPAEDFVAEAERWFSLSHPNVIKIFGASHLRAPFSAVFEDVLSTNLREYLALDASRHLVWTKLHEVALGVKYLHERGVVLGNLQCRKIWIGTNGLAKIAGLEPGASVEHPACIRWMAPECLRSNSPTAASDIYSLGVCIVEALSGDVPWSDEKDDRIASLVEHGSRPHLPDAIDKSQMGFLRRMWLRDPLKRPTIAIVVEQLKTFAEQSAPNPHRAVHPSPRSVNASSSNVEEFIFPELGSTIPGFLQELKSKCDLCRDAPVSISYIYDRLDTIYNTMTATETRSRPSDVQVVKFCEVLVRFHGQLKITISKNSMLQFVKSLKVALVTDLFHKQIDGVLALSPTTTQADPIHEWRQQAELHRQSDFGTADCDSQGTTRQVNLVEQESEGMNRNFLRVNLSVGDSEAENRSLFIPLHELKYDKMQEIGKGAFGNVYKASWLGTTVVVKFTGYEEDGDESHRRLFFHELRIWYPLNHPNVIKLYGAGDIGKRYFVCEFAGNGALLDYLKKDGNQKKTWQKLHEVAQGLAYLHEQNVVHNDLKCDNFLVGSDESAKIIDFGLSCIPNVAQVQIAMKNQGAVRWRSPEYLRGEKSTLASDVYAFGMCILEAVTRSPPWGSIPDAAVRFQVVRRGNLPQRPDVLKDDSQWQLIERMGAKEPSERPGMASVVERLEEFAQQEGQSETTTMMMKQSAVQGIP